jgi:hypothetical protein
MTLSKKTKETLAPLGLLIAVVALWQPRWQAFWVGALPCYAPHARR